MDKDNDSNKKIILKQKIEIKNLKRKIVELEGNNELSNNKRQRVYSEDIIEDENTKIIREIMSTLASEYIEILYTEKDNIKKHKKNHNELNNYINTRMMYDTEYNDDKYEMYLQILNDKISDFKDLHKSFDPNYYNDYKLILTEFKDLNWFGFLCTKFQLFNLHITNINRRFRPLFNKYFSPSHGKLLKTIDSNPMKVLIKVLKNEKQDYDINILIDFNEYFLSRELKNELFNSIKDVKKINLKKLKKNITDVHINLYKKLTQTKKHKKLFLNDCGKRGKRFLRIIKNKEDERLIEEVGFEIKTIDDLLRIDTKKKYNFDVEKIDAIKDLLIKIKEFIGLDKIKVDLVHNIKYVLLNLNDVDHMYHMVISGPPGVGKSTIGEVLGEIYCKLGLIKSDKNYKFVKATRSDLIGQYLGQTDKKTQKKIDEALGGILFIDEAYSIGSTSTKDIYAKECLDTLNRNLTEKKGEFVCIIAGYKEELDNTFFRINPGLRSRFNTKFHIEKYSPKELANIFKYMVDKNNWIINNTILDKLSKKIEENRDMVKYEGRAMENLFLFCKKEYSSRVFGNKIKIEKNLTWEDIENSWERLYEKKHDIMTDVWNNMYL